MAIFTAVTGRKNADLPPHTLSCDKSGLQRSLSGTLCLQANITKGLQTGTQVWLGIGIQLTLDLTETLLVRTEQCLT